jgi:hypothetical protein
MPNRIYFCLCPIPWGTTMLVNRKLEIKRIVNLIKAVREIGAILPGDKVILSSEKPATYLGAFEEGDMQVDYIQLHAFELFDGLQVVLESPSLNRSLGKLLY